MFAPESLALINKVALELARQGKPERDALFLVTDPRKGEQLRAVLASADSRLKKAA